MRAKKLEHILSPTEHNLQSAYFQWVRIMRKLDDRYWLITAIPNQRAGDMTRLRYWREGVESGWPDVFIAVAAHGWHGLFLEFKRKGGKPTLKQTMMHDKLMLAGYDVAVVDSFEAAKELTEIYFT